jgi:hypothetical protein
MLSRRGFLGWIFGGIASWRGGESEEGTPVHKRERPAESMQQLIQQVRFLERSVGSKEHVQAIQDQIRIRLLLEGLACTYVEENGQHYVCALETSTGHLWCLPLSQSTQPWACEAWERIGLSRLESRIKTLSRACDI